MIVGGWLAGDGDLDGIITDIYASTHPAGVDINFLHLVDPGTEHSIAVTIDGELWEILPSEDSETSLQVPVSIGSGTHRIDVHPIRHDTRRIPSFIGDPWGNRAYLAWAPSTASDLHHYAIYSNGGDGEIDYDSAVAIVDQVEIEPYQMQSGNGGGDGRISIFGSWADEPINTIFTVQTNAEAQYRHNLGGEWSPWEDIISRSILTMEKGVSVLFEDLPSSYDGAEFVFRIGPRFRWMSGFLEPGEWKFGVKPVDAAGNEGQSEEETVIIIGRPSPLGNLRFRYDPFLADQILIQWVAPGASTVDSIDIFSNYSKTYDLLTPHIIEDTPWATVGPTFAGYGFNPPIDGIWKFYVRSKDSNDVYSDDIRMIVIDTTVKVPTTEDLNRPERVIGRPGPSGSVFIGWSYQWDFGQSCIGFKIYQDATELAEVLSSGVGVQEYELHLEGPFSEPVTLHIASISALGGEWHSESITIIPDDEAPSLPGDLDGVPN